MCACLGSRSTGAVPRRDDLPARRRSPTIHQTRAAAQTVAHPSPRAPSPRRPAPALPVAPRVRPAPPLRDATASQTPATRTPPPPHAGPRAPPPPANAPTPSVCRRCADARYARPPRHIRIAPRRAGRPARARGPAAPPARTSAAARPPASRNGETPPRRRAAAAGSPPIIGRPVARRSSAMFGEGLGGAARPRL